MHIGHGSSPTTCCRYKPNASSATETRQTAANTRRGAASNQFNNIDIPQRNRRQTVMAIVAQKAAPSSRRSFCPFPLLCCCSRELVPAIGRSHEEPASKKNAPGVLGRFSCLSRDERLPWVRRRPQIRLQFLEALREELLGIGVGYRGGDYDVGASTLDRPVRRRAHLVLTRQLQCIECTQ